MNFTKIGGEPPAFSSPSMTYHKWQAYDDFYEFKTKNSGLKYLLEIATRIQNAGKDKYEQWFSNYRKSLEKLGAVNLDRTFSTNWRLIVGMGTNPALETGIQLHHLYGFPYIPGSAVKGLLHHVAELELCEDENWKIEAEAKQEYVQSKWPSFIKALEKAEFVRILFGSLFIQKNKYEKKKENGEKIELYSGLDTPLEWFADWKRILKDSKEHNDIYKRLIKLMSEDHIGGILTFFDAMPTENTFKEFDDVLQTDILNPHYKDYYQDDKNQIPPSDDQDPNPIYFLAVRPGVKFVFPYRIANFSVGEGRDEPEEERVRVLKDFSVDKIIEQVNKWLQEALTEWGIGAKTAAGYGYFQTDAIDSLREREIEKSERGAKKQKDNSKIPNAVESTFNAIQPPNLDSKNSKRAILSRINKNYDQVIWNRIVANEYILKVEGQNANRVPLNYSLPCCEISKDGKQLMVYYQNNRFFCKVEVVLQGVTKPEHAQWVWENIILPELQKLK